MTEFLLDLPGSDRRASDDGGIPEACLANPMRCTCEIIENGET